MSYPLPIPGDPRPILAPQPATIIVPRAGRLIVRHYWGDSASPTYDRLWVTLPIGPVEVTTGGRANAWPGDALELDVDEGQELEVAINGTTLSSGSGSSPRPGPHWSNESDNARVHEGPLYQGGWVRYIEWEDLTRTAANAHYNDSRTLIYFPGGWKVGRL